MYEIIQAVTYCFMYNVQEADILQVLRTSVETKVATNAGTGGTKFPEEKTEDVVLHVHRVSLDSEDQQQHMINWETCILPRLRTFVEAVYRVRADDDKRYRFLAAISDTTQPAAAWNMLFDEVPFLKSCDTAFDSLPAT